MLTFYYQVIVANTFFSTRLLNILPTREQCNTADRIKFSRYTTYPDFI